MADPVDVLFVRDFRRFSGGHLKVWHYFGHVMNARGYEPWARFTRDSLWDETNPWHAARDRVVTRRRRDPDVLFLAGIDWLRLTKRERRHNGPVINLVQHVRHADPEDIRSSFLGRPAVRICVGPEVADAIAGTGRVRGPVFTIPNAVDVGGFEHSAAPDAVDLLVVADKDPAAGRRIHERLRRPGRVTCLLDHREPRSRFLGRLRAARVTLFLPAATEGFYLPALEGMALGTLVVCRDCIGNRSFCIPGRNCLRPEPNEETVVEAAELALALPDEQAGRMREEAHKTAAAHNLASERSAFQDVLARLDDLWAAV